MEAKKKLLFVLYSFEIGGTTVSTRHLLSILDTDKYDVTLWVLRDKGILKWMYEGVLMLPSCFIIQALTFNSWREGKNWLQRISSALLRYLAHHSKSILHLLYKIGIQKSIGNNHFDTVVACQESVLSEFVSLIKCPNRIAWVRCDYKRYISEKGGEKESFYKNYNHIVCVSEQTQKSFVEFYPEFMNRTVCIHNPQDSQLIINHSNYNDHDSRFNDESTVIVSVGRLDIVKRFDEIPSIARSLLDKDVNFKWYIIGEGPERDTIATKIKDLNVSDHVVMLGAKSNPHFYIKHAYLYVCLSSSEACPRVINEAKILGTPCVSTDFPSIYEFLEDGVNGRIAPLEKIPQTICELLSDKQQYIKIKNEITGFSFDNTLLAKRIYNIL